MCYFVFPLCVISSWHQAVPSKITGENKTMEHWVCTAYSCMKYLETLLLEKIMLWMKNSKYKYTYIHILWMHIYKNVKEKRMNLLAIFIYKRLHDHVQLLINEGADRGLYLFFQFFPFDIWLKEKGWWMVGKRMWGRKFLTSKKIENISN